MTYLATFRVSAPRDKTSASPRRALAILGVLGALQIEPAVHQPQKRLHFQVAHEAIESYHPRILRNICYIVFPFVLVFHAVEDSIHVAGLVGRGEC